MSKNSIRFAIELATLNYHTSPFVAPEQQGGADSGRFPYQIERRQPHGRDRNLGPRDASERERVVRSHFPLTLPIAP